MQTVDIGYFSTLVGHDEAMRLIGRSGLAGTDGALPPALDLPTFWRLCAENIQSHNDESHGISVEPVPRGSVSVLFTAAKEADTLIEALERFAATARLIRKECQIVVGKGRQAVHLTVRPRDGSSLRAEIYVECFAIVTHCALRWMTGRRLNPVLVRGSAKLQDMGDTMLASLNAPLVRRGEGVTILYGKHDMNAPILAQKYKAWGDQEFESFLALIHEHDDATGPESLLEMHSMVRKHLWAGLRSQEAVSEAMHLSVATLRRRLTDEGTSFRRLSTDARRTQLQDLLATDTPIDDMAEKLGFSDDRSLRRFCRDNLGMSPRRYRQLLRGLPSGTRAS